MRKTDCNIITFKKTQVISWQGLHWPTQVISGKQSIQVKLWQTDNIPEALDPENDKGLMEP